MASGYSDFKIKAKFSWYSKTVTVRYFSYMLAQYLPTVYAVLFIYIDKLDFNDFKAIDNLPLANRRVELWFEPSLQHNNKEYFSGNYKFICTNMDYQNAGLVDMVVDENTKPGAGYFITLHCIDRVYYNMTLNKKYNGFPNQNISSVIRKITTDNGGTIGEIIETDYKYNWIQAQMTDADMIRSLLPYARSTNNELLYDITFFNEKCYFVPVTHGFNTSEKIIIDFDKANTVNYNISDNKSAIERYTSVDNLYCINHGYDNFEYVKADKISKQAYIANKNIPKQHSGVGTQYINTAFEDKTLQAIYSANLRQRMLMFNVMLEMSISAIPDIMCYNVIEMINQIKGTRQVLDNLYYIIAIKYEYYNLNTPKTPVMHLCLSSEFDYSGTESAEGQGITEA